MRRDIEFSLKNMRIFLNCIQLRQINFWDQIFIGLPHKLIDTSISSQYFDFTKWCVWLDYHSYTNFAINDCCASCWERWYVTNKIAHRWSKSTHHFTWKKNPNSAYIITNLLIRDRPRGRVSASSTERRALSPAFPDDCKIDCMAQRATLSYNLRPFRFKSYYVRPSRLLIHILHHTTLFTAWYIIHTYVPSSIKIVSRLWQHSFGIQNRCKFVERFFLSVGVITCGRCSYSRTGR